MEGRYDSFDEVRPHLRRAEELKLRIKTEHVNPPIPLRDSDWSAVDDATYAGPESPMGWGATEQDAIDDLLLQLGVTV